MSQLTFNLETFKGPLDLLLVLIKKNKVNIYDIPISEILDQYLQVMKEMKELDLEISSEFMVLAATLLQIKSKMLHAITIVKVAPLRKAIFGIGYPVFQWFGKI